MSPRFIDNRFGLNGTERVIVEFMYAIQRIDGQDRCKEILKALLCEYFLPPCNEKNEPYKYCREDCEAVFETCNAAMREMLGAAKYILEKLGLEFHHVGVPNCTKLRYSASFKAENTSCVHFGLFSKYVVIITSLLMNTSLLASRPLSTQSRLHICDPVGYSSTMNRWFWSKPVLECGHINSFSIVFNSVCFTSQLEVRKNWFRPEAVRSA